MYFIWGSVSGCLSAILSGVLLDIDHFLDYGIEYGFNPFNFSLHKLYGMGETLNIKRLFLVLHSFELLVLFWLSVFIFKWGIFWIALGLGITAHMFFDQIINRTYWFTYFLLLRATKGFRAKEIFRI